MAQVWIDLDHISTLAEHSRWWSVEKFNVVSFCRKDYLPGDDDLKKAVIDKIHLETGQHFDGKVFLLTNLRYWGYCYNPVSFYFCYDQKNRLQYILDDINNTPWNERYCYVHDCFAQLNHHHVETKPSRPNDKPNDKIDRDKTSKNKKYRFSFDKAFHVSPFMPMNLFYQWHYLIKQNSILIHMELFDKTEVAKQQASQQLKFYANMSLDSLPLNKKNAHRLPLKFPFLCGKIVFGIYWNALKLWIKKIPFYDHP